MPPSAEVNAFIKRFVETDYGSSPFLLDALIPQLGNFLKFNQEKRPVAIYDHHGVLLHRSEAEDYGEALVLHRFGVNRDNFWIIVPPTGFTVPHKIPIPKEQKTDWDGFRTAYVHTNGNSFLTCLGVMMAIKSREELRRIVLSLEVKGEKPKLIADVVERNVTLATARHQLAQFCNRNPQIVEDAIKAAADWKPAPPLALDHAAGKENAEEDILAMHYLETDPDELWINAINRGELNDVEGLTKTDTFANMTLQQVKAVVALSMPMVWSVNRFYANKDLGAKPKTLPHDQNPLKEFTGEREVPISAFFTNDTRCIERPFVSDLDLRGDKVPVLPGGPRIDVAIVGGGMAAANTLLWLAKIASASRRHINATVLEACPNIWQLGRFLSVIFGDLLTGEIGAMRMAATSIPWFGLLEEIFGPLAKVKTFPNQHVVPNFFLLQDMYGQRGFGAVTDGHFKTVIEHTVQHIHKKFREISTTVAGKTITFDDILTYLLTNCERTPDKSQQMLAAFVKIAYEKNVSLDVFIKNAVEDGLRTGSIAGTPNEFQTIVNCSRESPGALTQAQNIILAKMGEERRIGAATGGWDDYGNLSVVEQLTNETIGPYDEYFLPELKENGLQELGRFMRDRAREIGGEHLSINWEYGKSVRGLGKGNFNAGTNELGMSAYLYQTIDPATCKPVGEPHLRECHFIIPTVSPVVLTKIAAPQSGGISGRVELSGQNVNGEHIRRSYITPFKIFAISQAALREASDVLPKTDLLVREWMTTTQMFNTTKIMFTAPADLWRKISPKDQHYLGSGAPKTRILPNGPLVDAATYVLPTEFLRRGDTSAIPKTYLDEVTETTTLSGDAAIYCHVPLSKVADFERQFTPTSAFRLTNHSQKKSKATKNDVYRLATEGPVPRAFQLPGSSPAVYVDIVDDKCLVLDYQWARGGDKSGMGVSSNMVPDPSDVPIKKLIDANNFLFGIDKNPLVTLAENRDQQASFNFGNSELYYGAFSALGVNDFAKSWPVQQFYKLALYWKYNPSIFSIPTIQPGGEHANINAGWIGPVLTQSSLNVMSFALIFGATLSPTAVQSFMGAPPLAGIEKLPIKPYPSFGLQMDEQALSEDFPLR